MKTQYRIAETQEGYFPQVRINWGRWRKITKHPSGFGMHPHTDREYPKTVLECFEIMSEFDKWVRIPKQTKYTYVNSDLLV